MEEWRKLGMETGRNIEMEKWRVEESVGQLWRCEMGDCSGDIYSDQEAGESLECVEGVDDMHEALWGGRQSLL